MTIMTISATIATIIIIISVVIMNINTIIIFLFITRSGTLSGIGSTQETTAGKWSFHDENNDDNEDFDEDRVNPQHHQVDDDGYDQDDKDDLHQEALHGPGLL